ncbi:nucleolar complex protein 14 [Exophiala xenobiotica]|nr:nucleolar complex protein 14 [Exophiala xenobiotica]KAK5295848.1 nucleolar complex protein 14 [Exophiala xenobiotica]KAK5492262.1 nucleolar complex protein 14 [Exophiala xenobiotica]
MAPSQLKQLKASLRDHGILGPQKSKKQRKATSKDAQKRNQRNAALESIRERFNPFEVKAPARKDKFEVASGRKAQPSLGRPGVTRGLGEERRRETLLKEMQSRNKVGGLLDRRFGENDPTMTPEQRAAERFARQNERKLRKTSMFNLEDDSEEEMALTHGGRSLDFGGQAQDDFDERDVAASDDDAAEFEGQNDRPRKKLRLEDSADTQVEEGVEEGDELPQRRKSKNEVMKEVIAKSKFYKAERQAAKADDDDLRAELNKGMSEFYEALRDHKPPEKQLPSPPVTEADPHMDPARAAMLAGKSRQDAEKEYEANLRALKLESRSKPSVRTKTEEEKAAEEAARLEELERKRMRRMKGEAESSDDDEDAELGPDEDLDFEEDDAEPFGLAAPEAAPSRELDVEDEDEFMLEDDLIASDSEAEVASEQGLEESESEDEAEDDGDDDFINGLVLPPGSKALHAKSANKALVSDNLAYTFSCPQTHEELLALVKDTKFTDLPTIIQRIRALYHKGLAQGNQEKLDVFAVVLTQHVAYLADNNSDVPFSVLESLLRHLHSMAKASPQAVGDAFRRHLESIAEERPLKLSPGDLVILTGVSTIFPTSDHFHAVVTPAMLTLGRYLGQSSPQSLHDLGVGAYCCSLALLYQRLAKRYVPEVIAYVVNALAILAPASLPDADKDGQPLNIPLRLPQKSLRTKSAAEAPGKLSFKQLVIDADGQDDAAKSLALLNSFIRLFTQAAELWKQKSAFPELVSPLIQTISHIISHRGKLPKTSVALASNTLETLQSLQKASIESRRPLLLHNHRPLAIKTSIPAFIENYNPDRHYDPDRQRADLAKLKAEHKKERKGAMRELRKDANFMAREQLREKKEKDVAYDKKFKRLVAEIQGEEGREKKEYEREKRKRQGRF